MATFRAATLTDREAICRVHTRAIREMAASAYAPPQIEAWAGFLTPESYTQVIKAGRVFVAEYSGRIVGFGQFNAETGEVEATYVLPDVRGRGVGRTLLSEAESRARAGGLTSIHVSASLNAVPFYEATGFMREKQAYHQLPSGVSLECVVMCKRLDGADAQPALAGDR